VDHIISQEAMSFNSSSSLTYPFDFPQVLARLKTFVLSEAFIHVLIARHRPESNGIAERFVRTLKEWLASKSWQTEQALAALLQSFVDEYNDRPHQGLPLPGLSPNEFAKRIWLL